MKTVINENELPEKIIRRVPDNVAKFLVDNLGYKYCPKSVWKKNIRDINKEVNLK